MCWGLQWTRGGYVVQDDFGIEGYFYNLAERYTTDSTFGRLGVFRSHGS